jgi:menaquinone-9 beta-reductase
MEAYASMYDLIVIGAGPAGSSAAITAARSGARVLLLERGRFPRNKVCGEFVSAESLDLLSSLLDLSGKDLLSEAHRIPLARIFSDRFMLPIPISPPAASVARFDMDAALWQAATDSGVETHEQATVQSVKGTGPFTVVANENAFECRALINASGRWSNLTARTNETSTARPKWLGLKAHFAEENPSPSVDIYSFRGGYCGVQPVSLREQKDENRINVCAMVRADVASSLKQAFCQNPFLAKRSQNWQPLMQPVSTSPLIFREPNPVDGNILMAGDAAGFVDPFVGDGISLALRSGNLCARSLAPFMRNEISLVAAAQSYHQAYKRELLPVFRISSKVRHLYFLLPEVARTMILAAFQRTPAFTQYLVRHTR